MTRGVAAIAEHDQVGGVIIATGGAGDDVVDIGFAGGAWVAAFAAAVVVAGEDDGAGVVSGADWDPGVMAGQHRPSPHTRRAAIHHGILTRLCRRRDRCALSQLEHGNGERTRYARTLIEKMIEGDAQPRKTESLK